MTIGNKVLVNNDNVIPVDRNYTCGTMLWTTTSGAAKPVGTYINKTWSGVDDSNPKPKKEVHIYTYPVQKRRVKAEYWYFSKRLGKLVLHKDYELYQAIKYAKVKLNPRPRSREDHPYSCVISGWKSSTYTLTTSGWCSGWFPDYRVWWTPKRIYTSASRADMGSVSSSLGSKWTTNDDLALIGKLREEVAGSDFNFGVFLGESHETLRMLATTATSIYKAARAIKRFDILEAQRALRLVPKTFTISKTKEGIANSWLELQYGWKPLLKDMHNGAIFLANQLSMPFQKDYRVRRKVKNDYTKPASYWLGAQVVNESRGQLIYRCKETNSVALSGLLDPASVAWELLPFSFVGDWVLPIGAYLDARGLASSLSGTFVTTRTEKFRAFANGRQSSGVDSYADVFVEDFYYSVNRTVSSNLNVPLPSVKTLDKVFSWSHAANAIALMSQAFK